MVWNFYRGDAHDSGIYEVRAIRILRWIGYGGLKKSEESRMTPRIWARAIRRMEFSQQRWGRLWVEKVWEVRGSVFS